MEIKLCRLRPISLSNPQSWFYGYLDYMTRSRLHRPPTGSGVHGSTRWELAQVTTEDVNPPVSGRTRVNLCLKRGRIRPKLSATPLTHCSCLTRPPAPSLQSSLATAAASTPAWSVTTTTRCGGPSLLPKRRFSVRT